MLVQALVRLLVDGLEKITILKLTFKPSRCIKASLDIPENRLNSPTTKDFRRKVPIKLFYQYMAILFRLPPTSNHIHPLQVENCDSSSRLVVDKNDNGKFSLERVNIPFHNMWRQDSSLAAWLTQSPGVPDSPGGTGFEFRYGRYISWCTHMQWNSSNSWDNNKRKVGL